MFRVAFFYIEFRELTLCLGKIECKTLAINFANSMPAKQTMVERGDDRVQYATRDANLRILVYDNLELLHSTIKIEGTTVNVGLQHEILDVHYEISLKVCRQKVN